MAVRFLAFLVAVSGLAIVAWVTLASAYPAAHGPVYSVARVRGQLARDPRAWVGRVVRLRARAELCPAEIADEGAGCGPAHPVLAPPDAADAAEPLPLAAVPDPPLPALLRRLPPLAGMLPAPQRVDWGSVAVYRVRLATAVCDPYQPPPCYAAQLLAGAPGTP